MEYLGMEYLRRMCNYHLKGQICVEGQGNLYQVHLATLSGLHGIHPSAGNLPPVGVLRLTHFPTEARANAFLSASPGLGLALVNEVSKLT